MEQLNNPFVIYGYKGAEYFCDRKNMFLSAKRPFYQSSQILNLPLINQDEYHHFANRWMGTRNLTMDSDTFAYLYNKVDGQTWYIQDILNRLYQNGKEITTAEIDDVTLELVNEQEVAFVNYYNSLTDYQGKNCATSL